MAAGARTMEPAHAICHRAGVIGPTAWAAAAAAAHLLRRHARHDGELGLGSDEDRPEAAEAPQHGVRRRMVDAGQRGNNRHDVAAGQRLAGPRERVSQSCKRRRAGAVARRSRAIGRRYGGCRRSKQKCNKCCISVRSCDHGDVKVALYCRFIL